MVQMWATKYLRVFRRKLAVEQMWVREELLKPIPLPPAEAMMEVHTEVKGEMNGHEHGDEEHGGKRVKMDEEADKIE